MHIAILYAKRKMSNGHNGSSLIFCVALNIEGHNVWVGIVSNMHLNKNLDVPEKYLLG